MKVNQGIILSGLLMIVASHSHAIEDLKIQVQGSDVVLDWPSTAGESYIIQHRTSLDAGIQWVTLSSSHPASTGAARTAFTHSGIVQTCSGGSSSLLVATSGEELLAMSLEGVSEPVVAPLQPALIPWWSRWQSENRKQTDWERERRPPLPWEAHAWSASLARQSLLSASAAGNSLSIQQPTTSESMSSGCPVDTGFYRVVRHGVHFFGITNGQVFSGLVSLPVEIGLANPSHIPMEVALAPLEDNEEDMYPSGIELYVLDDNSRAPSLLWDTQRTTNGTYTLKPAVTLKGGGVVSGPSVTVVVSNQIQMPKISDVMVSGLPIYAIIDQPNANYTITVRNAQGQVVRTMTGQAANYIINTFWNGLNDLGVNVLANHTYFDVTVSYNPSYTYRIWIFYEDDFLNGNWLIAYTKGLFAPLNELQLDNTMQQMADFAGEEGLAYAPYLQLRNGAADWVTMTNVLKMPDTRNFYYWGHGGPSALGFGSNDPNNGVTAGQMRRALGNVLSTNLTDIEILHAFRFVWLDGCQTGTKSSAWPQTFGIQPVQLDAADFALLGGAERAFLGWKKFIYFNVYSSARFRFAESFFENWLSAQQPLSDALDAAAIGTVGTSERKALQIWGNTQLAPQGAF